MELVITIIFIFLLLFAPFKKWLKRSVNDDIAIIKDKYRMRCQKFNPGDIVKYSRYGLECYSPYMQTVYKDRRFVVLYEYDTEIFTECGELINKTNIEKA